MVPLESGRRHARRAGRFPQPARPGYGHEPDDFDRRRRLYEDRPMAETRVQRIEGPARSIAAAASAAAATVGWVETGHRPARGLRRRGLYQHPHQPRIIALRD